MAKTVTAGREGACGAVVAVVAAFAVVAPLSGPARASPAGGSVADARARGALRVVARVKLRSTPLGIAAVDGTVYVELQDAAGDPGPSHVLAYDERTGARRAPSPIPNAGWMAGDPATGRLYVWSDAGLDAYSPTGHLLLSVDPGMTPTGFSALLPYGKGRVLFAQRTVRVFNRSLHEVRTLSVRPGQLLAGADARANMLYWVDGNAERAQRLTTGQIFPVDLGPGSSGGFVTVDNRSGRALVTWSRGARRYVSVVAAGRPHILRTLPAPANTWSVTADPSTQRWYALVTGRHTAVDEINPATGRTVRSVRVGAGVPKSVFDRQSNMLDVIAVASGTLTLIRLSTRH